VISTTTPAIVYDAIGVERDGSGRVRLGRVWSGRAGSVRRSGRVGSVRCGAVWDDDGFFRDGGQQ
jgi:hypothetical protein